MKTDTQQQTRHTPGPWARTREVDNSPDIHVISECGALVATVSHMVSFNPVTQDSEEMKANARLIAAAPDLLAALRNVGNVLAALATGQIKTVDRDSPALAQIREAIAKAEGRA